MNQAPQDQEEIYLSDTQYLTELMNKRAQDVVERLSETFGLRTPYPMGERQSICSIGIEIEVKWRDYFPDLWQTYFVEKSYRHLSGKERYELNCLCSAREQILLPKLNQTVECGVSKGADRYWEFALPPSTDIATTLNIVHILRETQLLPSGSHSLHVTVAGMKASADAYYLLMLLELLFCRRERIESGFSSEVPGYSAGWATKGRAGLYVKQSSDLLYRMNQAIELRVLELTDGTDLEQVLQLVSSVADRLHVQQVESTSDSAWETAKSEMKRLLIEAGLPDANWGKPSQNPFVWRDFITKFDTMQRHAMRSLAKHQASLCEYPYFAVDANHGMRIWG